MRTRFVAVALSLLFPLFSPAEVLLDPPAGVLRSASEVDYPPFCLVDGRGRADGFSVELLRHALAAMGRDVTFQTGTWPHVRDLLERGEVEVLPLVGRTPEREALFDFTFPYMTLFGAIVVRDGTTGIERVDDLRGRRVAVMRADNAEEFLRREDRGLDIRTTDSFDQALRELSAGQHDAVVMQSLVALRLLHATGLRNLRLIHRPVEDFRQDFCFATRKGNAATLALLNEGLSLAIADGAFRRLHAKWFAHMELPSGRRLIAGGDHRYPPYEYLNAQGEPEGFAVELLQAVARETGLDVEFRLGSWAQAVRALETGEIDVLPGIFYTEERSRKLDFTLPHAHQHYVSVVRTGTRPPARLDELGGLRLAIQEGDMMHDQLVALGLAEHALLLEGQADVLKAVAGGRADCGLVMRLSAVRLMEEDKRWAELALGQNPLYSAEYCMAVAKGNTALLTQLNEGLRVLKETGEYRRIQDRWLGVRDPESEIWSVVLKYGAMVLAPLLLIMLLSLAWSWSLRRKVASRTDELRRQEAFIRAVLDHLPIGVSVNSVDPSVTFTYMNDLFPALYRTTREALADANGFWEAVYEDPEAREQIRRRVLEDCASGDVARMAWQDIPITRTGGETTYISARNTPVPGANMMISTVWDVTDRRLTEQELQRMNRLYEALSQVNQAVVRMKTPDELFRQACVALVDFGKLQLAWIGKHDPDTGDVTPLASAGTPADFAYKIHHSARPESAHRCLCGTAIRQHRPMIANDVRTMPDMREWTLLLEQGGIRSAAVFPILRDDRIWGVFGLYGEEADFFQDKEIRLLQETVTDIAFALGHLEQETRRKEAEADRELLQEQLVQAQKMESVGRLAGGVAHDFNNLLMGIMGNAELARERIENDAPLREAIDEIVSLAKRSADLTRQLLAFARKQTIAPQILDFNDAVSGMLKMLRRLIGEDIDLAWLPGAGAGTVRMDPGQLDQILANLCVNARDAIRGVGKVEIETDTAEVDESYCLNNAEARTGCFVVLSVSDDGCGMTHEVMEHIFEPFYTTKEMGKGTGLGLATVYGIVKQNDGFINVYSEPGKGTTLRVYLPRVGNEAEPGNTGEQACRGGTESILLVEDEKSVRQTTALFLTQLGYSVLTADSPAEALDMAAAFPDPIHLLVTDVVMPGMNGRDLKRELARIRPGMKCLYISGYTPNVIAHRGVLDKDVFFLSKPFSRSALACKIRETLASRPEGECGTAES